MVYKFIKFLIGGKKEKALANSNKDMENVVNSIFLCNSLYDELKVKCHPDKFVDANMKNDAENLFQELQKNRYNHMKMLEIKDEVDSLLREKDM